jgi:hypothetical protein
VRVAQARRQRELLGEVVGQLAERGIALGVLPVIDRAQEVQRRADILEVAVGIGFLVRIDLFVEE